MGKKVRISSKGQIVIPKSYREALRLEEGSEAVVILHEDSIVLVNAADFARVTRGGLKGIWGRSVSEVDRGIEGDRQSWG
jgi:AbrB family looped-hinge helix DNA binding protein